MIIVLNIEKRSIDGVACVCNLKRSRAYRPAHRQSPAPGERLWDDQRAPNPPASPRASGTTPCATGITAYLKNGGTLEKAAQMANHASTRTTDLVGTSPRVQVKGASACSDAFARMKHSGSFSAISLLQVLRLGINLPSAGPS